MDINMEHQQLRLIEMMRFPLIVLVVFIHVIPESLYPIGIEGGGHAMTWYRFFSELISHNIGRIAVPCFFLFSGFLFFRNSEGLCFHFYKLKLRRRGRSLLLPYILWNCLLISAIFLKNYLCGFLHIENDEFLFQIRDQSLYAVLWENPINFPLWYMRDLMCMVVITPLFYILFRYLKGVGLILLTVVYLSTIELGIPGFSTTAILFFGLGSYLAIYKKNLLSISLKLKIPGLIIALFSLSFALYYNTEEPHEYIIRLFALSGTVTALNLTYVLMERTKVRELLSCLSQTVVFIYAIHEIYIINFLKGWFHGMGVAGSGMGMLVGYLTIPLLTLCICIGLFLFLKKTAPCLLFVLIGDRNQQVLNKQKGAGYNGN